MRSLSSLLLGALLALPAVDAQAREAANDFLRDAVGAGIGIYSAIAVHELGHASAALAFGATDVRIDVPGPQCKLLCGQTRFKLTGPLGGGQRQVLAAAGFAASALAVEGVLSSQRAASSSIGQGLTAAHLYSNLTHVYSYYTQTVGLNGYAGNDIDSFASAGGNPHVLSVLLLAHTAYTLKRLNDRNTPLLFIHLRF